MSNDDLSKRKKAKWYNILPSAKSNRRRRFLDKLSAMMNEVKYLKNIIQYNNNEQGELNEFESNFIVPDANFTIFNSSAKLFVWLINDLSRVFQKF